MAEKTSPDYTLGTEGQLKWKNKYFFGPKGIGFSEPGIVGLDDAKMSAYNVAKSSYQIHPDVFNMIVIPFTSIGCRKRIIASRKIPPTITIRIIALMSETRMVAFL